MNWLVYGDDWGAHPSTTQYLFREIAKGHTVSWVNSLGMRSPKPTPRDMVRALEKIRNRASEPWKSSANPSDGQVQVIEPGIIPFHRIGAVRKRNYAKLLPDLPQAVDVTLLANPVGVYYLPPSPGRLVYLRLDDYEHLPGVDAKLVREVEAELLPRCERIVVTAETLTPCGYGDKTSYLPQGVDLAHWSTVPLQPPAKHVLGFFGLLAEWLDFDLMVAVARANPDWSFEYVGPHRVMPPAFTAVENIKVLPGVPYQVLPACIAHWSAAWAPFKVNTLTKGVNPLKLREYLAAGLPALCTSIPEAQKLQPDVTCVGTAEDVSKALSQVLQDSAAARLARRERMKEHAWAARAAQLVDWMSG